MTFAEYQSQVLEYYLKRKAAGKLFFASPYATPAKIKAGCLEVLENNYDRRDESFLRSYFKMGNSLEFIPAVRKFDTDRFRPLNSYLRDTSKNPSPEHIELLAWLVDYAGRPYKTSYELSYDPPAKVETPDKSIPSTNSTKNHLLGGVGIRIEPPAVTVEEETATRIAGTSTSERNSNEQRITQYRTKRILYVVCAFVLISAGIIYWNVNAFARISRNGAVVPVIGQRGCAVWEDDHYESAACKQSVMGIASLGLDVSTVRNLKRITLPETLTVRSIGKVWYVKINGQLEYYTTAGFHPIQTELRLKPLTRYMYNKYLYQYSDKTERQAGLFNWFNRSGGK